MIGTFADRASREHINQIVKQKKVVFGERPLSIGAQTLKATAPTTELLSPTQSMQQSSQSANNQSINDGSSQKSSSSVVPWYIISQENNVLRWFSILMGLLAVPSFILNLFFIAFGFDGFYYLMIVTHSMEIFFIIEIIIHFFTSYKDPETFESVFSLKKIAWNYMIHNGFIFHLLAAFPFHFMNPLQENDPNENILRNWMVLKLLRLSRLNSNSIPDETILVIFQTFSKPEGRDDKIAQDQFFLNVIKIMKQVLATLMTTYLLGLTWYRFSDHWQAYLTPDEPEERFFVVYFGLRPKKHSLFNNQINEFSYETEANLAVESGPKDFNKKKSYSQRLLFGGTLMGIEGVQPQILLDEISERLVTCMYYTLTTLATVGYGDFYPKSIAEKIVGSIVQIFGVTFFSILMNNFIDVVLSMKSSKNFGANENKLSRWFELIKKMKNQPLGGNKDINPKLKDRIEAHFRYFWDNDRTAALLEKKDYFDQIPFKIQEHIMCQFLFKDIIEKAAFNSFFKFGKEFDPKFVFEVSFGFMPRQFSNTQEDRYMLREEADVTEIYFISKGEWAVAFNGFMTGTDLLVDETEYVGTPEDMKAEGKFIAMRRINFGYIGDYYVLASKRSQFHYVALSTLDCFAITKQFMFKKIFQLFPGLHSEMLAESFCRYIKEIRKPVSKKRSEIFDANNKKMLYSKVNSDSGQNSMMKNISLLLKQTGGIQKIEGLQMMNQRNSIFKDEVELQDYKNKLEDLNEKANGLFEHMKQINKLVNKKIMDIESGLTRSESIIVDDINVLIKNKKSIANQERKNYVNTNK